MTRGSWRAPHAARARAGCPGPHLGRSLQIQCYQCEEFHLSDCSAPENIANCTVNVQNVCQKEVMVRSNGTFYRKSCASSAACLIASAGYQTFCVPGRMGSVCISCCGTALCNGPRPARRRNSAWRSAPPPGAVAVLLLQLLLLQEQLQLLPVLLPLLPSPPLPRL
ncbi:ly6/PLAUR domain-containing protein 1 isoform X1 [Lethenteron reissneri]|uniref:ly6/PLAUR domain-containing protein 1 isoform X1 n=1 Tax=Lethenteron reissneri TaxID=7753 RepID=UPI002AB5EE4B|nr:ly6/PLAUR domain-containing protein 1 isoform X1 [Lethenteron reissneri]